MQFHRLLISGTGRTFIQDNPGEDVHSQYGRIAGDAIDAAADGEIVRSDQGEGLVVFTPSFIDRYKRIRRDAQIITFKDAGVILTTAGLGPHSKVAEAGSGSGALTTLLAQHCEQVHSYDIDPEHLAVARQNVEDLGFTNVTFAQHDLATGIPAHDLDCLILDMPEPWNVFEHIPGALKVGGYVVTYVPSTVQLQRLRRDADALGLLHVRSTEVSERHWMVKGDAVRPTSRNVAFTAFLSFFRWMGPEWASLRPAPKPSSGGPRLPDEEIMRAAF